MEKRGSDIIESAKKLWQTIMRNAILYREVIVMIKYGQTKKCSEHYKISVCRREDVR